MRYKGVSPMEDMDSNQKSPKEDFASRRKLGELLIESGLLTIDKINDALDIQKKTGKRLGEVLIEMQIHLRGGNSLCLGHAA